MSGINDEPGMGRSTEARRDRAGSNSFEERLRERLRRPPTSPISVDSVNPLQTFLNPPLHQMRPAPSHMMDTSNSMEREGGNLAGLPRTEASRLETGDSTPRAQAIELDLPMNVRRDVFSGATPPQPIDQTRREIFPERSQFIWPDSDDFPRRRRPLRRNQDDRGMFRDPWFAGLELETSFRPNPGPVPSRHRPSSRSPTRDGGNGNIHERPTFTRPRFRPMRFRFNQDTFDFNFRLRNRFSGDYVVRVYEFHTS
jgi:hypothetical protein